MSQLERAVADPVTTPATAAAVPILRNRAARATVVGTFALKVIRVARGTIGHEGRIGPRHGLGVVAMARRTQQGGTVIQRFVTQADMLERMRQPRDGVMALAAFPGRDEVTREFAGRRGAIVAG